MGTSLLMRYFDTDNCKQADEDLDIISGYFICFGLVNLSDIEYFVLFLLLRHCHKKVNKIIIKLTKT